MEALPFKKGIVFETKKGAVDDGPGIRTTIFFKGCPLRCWWCHNPEGQVPEPELMYRNKRCIGYVACGECVRNCPREAISHATGQISINRKHCNLCGKCSQKCPTDALMIIGKEMDVEEVVKEIDKDLVFYDESEGGVTVSGGEPLLQLDFLNALLEECKKKSIHTAVDTCGYASHKAIDRISDKVDLFLYDIKMMNDKMHRKYTGVSNKRILENFKKLAENGKDLLVRFPVIPEINDNEDNVTKTAEFILSYGIKRISLLPYHKTGIEKYRNLSRAYRLEKTQTPSEQNLKLIGEKLETFGLKVTIGGG
jgi:pyruvate formate lyase activating enzyme